MSEMSNYFEVAERRGAVLLDASNYDEKDFPPAEHVREILERAGRGGIAFGYDDPAGSYGLRERISAHESEIEGSPIGIECVSVNTGGATGTIDGIFRVLAKKGAENGRMEIVIPVPAYPEIERTAIYNGLVPVKVRTSFENSFQPDPDEINSAVSGKTAAVFLSTPSNPAGTFLPAESFREIARATDGAGAYLISDAVFEEAREDPYSQKSLVGEYPHILKIKGISKDRPHLNDLRVGWCVSSDPEIIGALRTASEVASFSVPMLFDSILQREMELRIGMGRYLKGEPLEQLERQVPGVSRYFEEVASHKRGIAQGIALAEGACEKSGVVSKFRKPDAGNLIYVEIDREAGERAGVRNTDGLFYRILEGAGIGVTPGHVFGTPENELWFRTTISRKGGEYARELERALGVFRRD